MPAIDLHAHSTASDGSLPPAEVMRAAADAGLDVVALTDHDTTAGWAEAVAALPPGLSLVRGIEVSCTSAPDGGGISLHVLAYLLDPEEPSFAERSGAVRDSRDTRGRAIVDAMAADGVPVTFERVTQIARGGVVGRPHIAQALVELGLVPDVSAAFTPRWLGRSSPYYREMQRLDAVSAVRLIRGAGGVPVFAHPFAARRGRVVGEDVIVAMAEAGLGGLEGDHPDHDPAERARARALAAELGLFVTGSSDFHGDRKDTRLGDEQTDPDVFEQIVAQASGVPVVTG